LRLPSSSHQARDIPLACALCKALGRALNYHAWHSITREKNEADVRVEASSLIQISQPRHSGKVQQRSLSKNFVFRGTIQLALIASINI
jgi:hypothetical protein